MWIGTLLLLLVSLGLGNVFCSPGTKRAKPGSKRPQKPKELNGTVTGALTGAAPAHETCLGYYDVSGQFDREFACNNTEHRFCCGSCFLRFCCQYRANRLEQRSCRNYRKPDWVRSAPPSPAPTGEPYDPSADRTSTAVLVTGGLIAFLVLLGVSAKVAYDKATEPPQEMNIHRALADILRPMPFTHYDCEKLWSTHEASQLNQDLLGGVGTQVWFGSAGMETFLMACCRSSGGEMYTSEQKQITNQSKRRGLNEIQCQLQQQSLGETEIITDVSSVSLCHHHIQSVQPCLPASVAEPYKSEGSNPRSHFSKESSRGAADLHSFISSGFVTLGRSHSKGTVKRLKVRAESLWQHS
ncbi:hypothetical protein DNTS_020487 [Danionella cerebrum]|uniref:Shisa N-terminal domain-containing protein n=1 Tax=Danionella cerebrum TaxID=2873325 RepID=A0A553Q4K0_9TELE|nr:hypothetical protein DNTS_020487 [Danionella translucida]